jgi:hypothetical protein
MPRLEGIAVGSAVSSQPVLRLWAATGFLAQEDVMKPIMSAVFSFALAVSVLALVSAPASALETQAASPAMGRNVMKVFGHCTIWVSACIKRFGDRSPKHARCLRNHGC